MMGGCYWQRPARPHRYSERGQTLGAGLNCTSVPEVGAPRLHKEQYFAEISQFIKKTEH